MSKQKICKWYNTCPLKIFYEAGKLDRKWIENYCWGGYSKCVRRQMEDNNKYHPDNMLPDGTINQSLK